MVSLQAETEAKIYLLNTGGAPDPTCATFCIREEDHTLGNALKHVLSTYKEVQFCGYNTPHPLEDKITVRMQTYAGHSAVEMFRRALRDTQTIFTTVREKSTMAIEQYRQQQQQSAPAAHD